MPEEKALWLGRQDKAADHILLRPGAGKRLVQSSPFRHARFCLESPLCASPCPLPVCLPCLSVLPALLPCLLTAPRGLGSG